jgi:hypothetical protein
MLKRIIDEVDKALENSSGSLFGSYPSDDKNRSALDGIVEVCYFEGEL